jgi:hypothetical protein
MKPHIVTYAGPHGMSSRVDYLLLALVIQAKREAI